jgi:hypothetical protein
VKKLLTIWILSFLSIAQTIGQTTLYNVDFYGGRFTFNYNKVAFASEKNISISKIQQFYKLASATSYQPVTKLLIEQKAQLHLDDWLFYQLIRKTAQQIAPKNIDYNLYTLHKWFLLLQCGYNAIITTNGSKLLLYVECSENIYNIPNRVTNGKQYVCLNYHDYKNIDFEKETFTQVPVNTPAALIGFSYKINSLPVFNNAGYTEKDIHFSYYNTNYEFKVKLNDKIKELFANYPIVDYESSFNIPLSKETYASLIPILKQNTKGLKVKDGVDYLMRFTRDAFAYQKDEDNFGGEKRLTPEQTLLYDKSDCEDRAALFFCLVKEIYDLPMIVLAYPEHVTIAVKFSKPVGQKIMYNGDAYSVCEPTPQLIDLSVGQILPSLKKKEYEIVYAYTPATLIKH